MTTYLWTINQMDRNTVDGFVVTVHYNVSALDEDNTASTYGTCSYTQEDDAAYIPFADLTADKVVSWVQTSLDKEVVEDSLQRQLDALNNPTQKSGLPWATV